jgi:hypothetical protein
MAPPSAHWYSFSQTSLCFAGSHHATDNLSQLPTKAGKESQKQQAAVSLAYSRFPFIRKSFLASARLLHGNRRASRLVHDMRQVPSELPEIVVGYRHF